jgi:large subunit ribosomal protein L6
MSRIGKKIIPVPKGVEVTITGQSVKVKGPKGTLERAVHTTMRVVKAEGTLSVEPTNDSSSASSQYHGLTRSLISNMVQGVTEGFSKSLLLRGVGYPAALKGTELQLTLGYSHPVLYPVPKSIAVKIDKLGNDPMIVIEGIDKELVGQTAANIRSFRKPEPYHGKGVRYADEVIVTKVGKSGAKK